MHMDYTKHRKNLVELLKKSMNETRFEHSLETEKTAIELAKLHGADVEKAGLAGLMHDITKQMDNLALAAKYGLNAVSEKILHGHTAACWLKEHKIVSDEEVLLAIRYHTTGRADMTMLEKIIFLADYIEPTRNFHEVTRLRRYAKENLDKAVLYGLELSILSVIDRKNLLDMDSVAAYNCYVRNINMEG